MLADVAACVRALRVTGVCAFVLIGWGGVSLPALAPLSLLALAACSVGASLLIWSARRWLRRLCDPKRVPALRALAIDPRPEVQEIVGPLLADLNLPGREVTPARCPAGDGREPAPAADADGA
jgi:hypothetical protein